MTTGGLSHVVDNGGNQADPEEMGTMISPETEGPSRSQIHSDLAVCTSWGPTRDDQAVPPGVGGT